MQALTQQLAALLTTAGQTEPNSRPVLLLDPPDAVMAPILENALGLLGVTCYSSEGNVWLGTRDGGFSWS